MTKIVYNNCFGGFSLSKQGIELYAELAGIKLYSVKETYDICYYTDPEHKNYWSSRDIPRTDPALVQVIETIGSNANGSFAELAIHELPSGTKYRIDEYDGIESVMTPEDYVWSIA